MKIEKVPTVKEFEPRAIKIVIETQNEYESLMSMTIFDDSIPSLCDTNHNSDVKEFIHKLREAL